MSRPLRIEFPGALFHVTARGNERRDIFLDDRDREFFLTQLREAVECFGWIVTAYALMPNHYHLLLELTETTLSRGMKWLNETYAQAFNRRHNRVGHLFQGPFKAPLIEKETYFLEVARYVVLNPVRAGMVSRPEQYPWTSYGATVGSTPRPEWLAVDDLLLHFGDDRDFARASYEQFVHDPIAVKKHLWADLVSQQYLGTDGWLKRVQEKIEMKPRMDAHPRSQRLIRRPVMAEVVASVSEALDIDEERVRHTRGGVPRQIAAWVGRHEALLTNTEIAAGLRMRSPGHVSDLINRFDRELDGSEAFRTSIDRCVTTLRRKMGETKLQPPTTWRG